MLLYLAAIGMAWWQVRKAIKAARMGRRESLAFQGNCIEMALVTQLVAAIFLSYLRGEWFYWLMAMCSGVRPSCRRCLRCSDRGTHGRAGCCD